MVYCNFSYEDRVMGTFFFVVIEKIHFLISALVIMLEDIQV